MAATLTDIMNFFGFTKASDFTREWKQLTPEDQAQIRAGLSDGTFTY